MQSTLCQSSGHNRSKRCSDKMFLASPEETEDIEDWRNNPESNPSVQLCGQKPKVDSVGRAQQLLVTGVKQRDVVSSRCEHPDEGFRMSNSHFPECHWVSKRTGRASAQSTL